jgi:hypothetical protein
MLQYSVYNEGKMMMFVKDKFYAIDIKNDSVNILTIQTHKKRLKILHNETLDFEAFKDFIKDKKNFHIVVDIEEALDEIITLPSVMKKDVVIHAHVLKKYKELLPSKDILLNYHKIDENKDDNSSTYKIDAIIRKDYIEKLSLIENWLYIKSASIYKFALLGLVRKCFDIQEDKGYLYVHTYEDKIIVLALNEQNDFIFERNSQIRVDVQELIMTELVEDVTQTIAYIKQQYRSIEFSTILLSGTIAVEELACEQLFVSTTIPVGVLYPNTIIEGLEKEEPQKHMLSLGAYFVDKKSQFIPDKVYSLKEFNYITLGLLNISFLIFLYAGYMMFENYISYTDELDKYESTKNRLIRMVKTTDTYSIDELVKSFKHLQIAEKFLKYAPADFLIELKPLINMQEPISFIYDNKNKTTPQFSIIFEKQFILLSNLHLFEKEFIDTFNISLYI